MILKMRLKVKKQQDEGKGMENRNSLSRPHELIGREVAEIFFRCFLYFFMFLLC